MKKLITVITLVLCAVVVRAEDTGITTSQAYVETKVAEKQDAAPANNTNSVMTYDSTSDDGIGAKAIYDATDSYSDQKDALMTAGTANAAIQNAINNEFTCANPPKCTLWNMAGIFQQDNPTLHASGKNLFSIQNANILFNHLANVNVSKTETGYYFTVNNNATDDQSFQYIVIEIGNIDDFIGKTLTLSTSSSCNHKRQWIGYSNSDGTNRKSMDANTFTITDQSQQGYTKIVIWLYAKVAASDPWCYEYSNIQVEEGENATAYEPYQNLYIPENQ